jgi:carboxyl-terminal processing protease
MMKKLLQILSYILVAALASSLTLILLVERPEQEYDKISELRGIIDAFFIGEADRAALDDAAAAGMISALGDRWSHYMTAEEFAAYQEQMANAYVGIGVTIVQREDGYIEVMKVEKNSPAEEAGILSGDVLTAVEGTDIGEMDINTIKNMVRGEANTQVRLTFRREEEILEFPVTRRPIETVVAEGTMLEDGIGLITIANFDSRCAEETIAVIEDLMARGARALIFDVRFNPGGYKSELVKLLDYLLPEGPLFRAVDYTGKETVDNSDAEYLDLPMAVLMNGDSYSAAEFFAAALREYGVAKLVGEPTTGKGRFQTSFPLSDGSAAVISIGSYCTPNGVSLADVGLTPDIPVEISEEQYMQIYYGSLPAAEDPQVQAAWQALQAS